MKRDLSYASLLLLAELGCGYLPPSPEEVGFGRAGDRDVKLYVLKNAKGMEARITSYGAILTSLRVPDRNGVLADVVLGFDRLQPYLAGHPYFGAIVGRVANRIANARFELDGVEYVLAANDGANHLHGGTRGFDKAVWNAVALRTAAGSAVELRYRSHDGEEGYPGNLDVVVRYTLSETNELKIEITARTDRPTPVNLTQHAYWNLAGHDAGDILGHELTIAAHAYTPTDGSHIPTGELAPVAGTPFDFTVAKPIGRDLPAGSPGGYDHNFVLAGQSGEVSLAARAKDPSSGRVMEVRTNQPGLQLYTANWLDGSLVGKDHTAYQRYQGLCLESQGFPDAVHHPEWPSVWLRPDQTYRHIVVHKFYAE